MRITSVANQRFELVRHQALICEPVFNIRSTAKTPTLKRMAASSGDSLAWR
jgi:hypothetical protein